MKTVYCILIIICIFIVHKRFKRNLKFNFHDKELPAMGSNSESVVLPVLDCLCNPKAVAPHTNLFSMHKKIKSVTGIAVCDNVAFYNCYFNHLPFCKTKEDAFKKASLDYFGLFKSFKYNSYEHFKTSYHGGC